MRKILVHDPRDVLPKLTGRYRSFPGWTRTASGEILLVYRDAESQPGVRSHGLCGDLMLMRQSGGRWLAPQLLYRHEQEFEEMGCGDLTRLSDGTIILWSRQYSAGRHKSYVALSRDDGRSFDPRQLITLDAFPGGYVPYGKLLEFPDRWLQAVYGRREGDTTSSAALAVSTDRGRSWQISSWIARAGDGRGLNYFEPFIFRLRDENFFCLLRTNGTFYSARSTDAGRTWSAPEKSFHGMACAGLVLSTGELLVTYRGIHPEPPDLQDRTIFERRGRLYCARLSGDGGRSWSEEVEIDGNTAWQIGSYGMGDVLEEVDGSIRVVYYTSDKEQTPWLRECRLEIR